MHTLGTIELITLALALAKILGASISWFWVAAPLVACYTVIALATIISTIPSKD